MLFSFKIFSFGQKCSSVFNTVQKNKQEFLVLCEKYSRNFSNVRKIVKCFYYCAKNSQEFLVMCEK